MPQQDQLYAVAWCIQVEVEVMLRAHVCYYAAVGCHHGTAALVQVAAASLPRLQGAGELKALAVLAAGALPQA